MGRLGRATAGARMGIARVGIGVGVVVGATACASVRPDPDDAAAAVEANLEGQGLPVDAVRCPPSEIGPLICTAVVGRQTLRMEVAIGEAEGEGALVVRPQAPMVVVAQLEPEIRSAVAQAGVRIASLQCPALVWHVAPKVTHRCLINADGGAQWWYEARFTGDGLDHTSQLIRIERGRAGVFPPERR